MSTRKIFLLCIALLFAGELSAVEIQRELLALWDSKQRDAIEYTETTLHQSLEVVANYFGLKLVYFDLAKASDVQKLKQIQIGDYRGVVTWFNGESVTSPDTLLDILELFSQKKPILILGSIGVLEIEKNKNLLSRLNKITSGWGLEISPAFVGNPLMISLKSSIKEDVEFERPLDKEILKARQVHSTSSGNQVWLSLEAKNYEKPFDVIVTGDWGGYVQTEYDIFTHPKTFRAQWRVNPFKLIEKVFFRNTNDNFPIPDVTTLCGKRIYYSHIDGDGFINVSNIDRKSLSGEIIFQNVIRKYKLPVTASIVVAEIDPNILGSDHVVNVTKEIFKNPYVEPASHTFSHPLSWSLNPSQREKENYLDDGLIEKHKGPIVAYKIKNYKMDYKREIKGSLDYINTNLTSRDKRANVLLWSGSCMPPVEAMDQLGSALNMNGGDSRFDTLYDSYNNLSSLYRKIGTYTQVYSGTSNENLYTNLWTGPYNGFKDLVQTLKRTEKPYRIKPINVYYHFYSGEHQSSLDALDEVFSYVKSQQITPVFSSQYIKTVNDFEKLKISRESDNSFIIKSDGSLRTLRMRNHSLFPNYKESRNILGHYIDGDVLYISLGEDKETKLVLTEKEDKTIPFLSQCNGVLDDFRVVNNKVKIRGLSHVPFELSYWNGKEFVTKRVSSRGYFDKEFAIDETP